MPSKGMQLTKEILPWPRCDTDMDWNEIDRFFLIAKHSLSLIGPMIL